MQRAMSAYEWGLLGALSVLWGASFLFIGIAVTGLPPVTLVAVRVTLAATVLIAVGALTGRRLPGGRRVWASFAVMGFLNNVLPFSLIAWAQTGIYAGTAAVLNATTPLMTVVFAHVLTSDERATRNKIVGVVIGLFGVAVLIGPDAIGGLGSDLLPELAVLLASVFYAVSSIFGRRFSRMGVSPDRAAAGQMTAAAIMLVPLSLAFDQPWSLPVPSALVIVAVVGLAMLSTALAYTIFYRILATAGATNLMMVTLLIPVSAMIMGAIFLGEEVSADQLAGLALIGLGLLAIDGRAWRALRSRFGTASPPV